MQLNCEIVENWTGIVFITKIPIFFFLLKLIIHVGGEWKGGGLIELLAGLLERSGTRTDRWSIWNLRQSLFHVIILQ